MKLLDVLVLALENGFISSVFGDLFVVKSIVVEERINGLIHTSLHSNALPDILWWNIDNRLVEVVDGLFVIIFLLTDVVLEIGLSYLAVDLSSVCGILLLVHDLGFPEDDVVFFALVVVRVDAQFLHIQVSFQAFILIWKLV